MSGWCIGLVLYGLALSGWIYSLRLTWRLQRQADTIESLVRRSKHMQRAFESYREVDAARFKESCQRMQRVADSFRELYLRELGRNQPEMAAYLREKWARENAPAQVALLLGRAKHG